MMVWAKSTYWVLGVRVAVLIFAFGVAFVVVERVDAYNNSGGTPCLFSYSGGGATLSMPYRNDTSLPPTGDYQTAFDAARPDWNSTYTPASFSFQTGSHGHYFVSADFGASGYFGKARWYCFGSGGTRSATEAWLNEYYLDSEGQNYKQSVAAHELGHWIGARHSTVSPAVMNSGRNRNTLYTAQEDDECAINDRYDSDWEVTC